VVRDHSLQEDPMASTTRLPGPVADVWDWQLRGACRGVEAVEFFHPDGDRGASREARERVAKGVCATCPVIRECAKHALSVREPYGVWGGMSEDDRKAVYRRTRLPLAG
jgi:WhiB family transcriptional regulator, redox-sensing transcriptional regulator